MANLNEILKAHNEKGLRFVQREEDEEPEQRDEDVNEASDLDLMGRFERFTS